MNPRGYQALHARICEAAQLTSEARHTLTHAAEHAPRAYTHRPLLANALFSIIAADDTLWGLLPDLHSLAEDEQRRDNAPRP